MRLSDLLFGLLLCALQLAVVSLALPGQRPGDAYPRLCNWDCVWYSSIAQHGYRSTVPPVRQDPERSNVAFFPGYPLVAAALARLTGWEVPLALIALAQAGAIVFWAGFFCLLRRLRVRPLLAISTVALFFAHPASFYLVASYSESLFLASLVGVLASLRRRGWAGTSVAGFVMCATRLVGLPLAALTWSLPRRWSLKGGASGLLAMQGAGCFLLYCAWRFGSPLLYFETQRIGWGVTPSPGAVFKAFTQPGALAVLFDWDRQALLASVTAFAAIPAIEGAVFLLQGKLPGMRRRFWLYGAALVVFAIHLSGLQSVGMASLVRYSLCWSLLLLIAWADLLSRTRCRSPLLGQIGLGVAFFVAIVSLSFHQWPALRMYLSGRWYA